MTLDSTSMLDPVALLSFEHFSVYHDINNFLGENFSHVFLMQSVLLEFLAAIACGFVR